MKDIPLGKIERLYPRSIWEHDAKDFTPWLMNNTQYLEEGLGFEIEVDNEKRQ